MLNDQKDKLCNNLEVSNRTNQFQTQVVTDRGNPLSKRVKPQTRSSDDSKSLNVELAHHRSRRFVVETNTENVPDGCETRSWS